MIDKVSFIHEAQTLLNNLFHFNYGVAGSYNSFIHKIYSQYGLYTRHTFDSGSKLNGWIIPNEWNPINAFIKCSDSDLSYDCLSISPLGVAYLSPSFSSRLTIDELKKNICTRIDIPNAIPYDWTRLYRNTKRDSWGLSIPYSVLSKFEKCKFVDINIKVKSKPSSMSVFDCLVPGHTNSEFIINAHNCHPYQANDDLSGVIICLLLSKYLHENSFYYSFRFVIAPELFGPLFWINSLSKEDISKMKGAILLKSVANDSSIKFQKSFDGNSSLDLGFEYLCKSKANNFSSDEIYEYRTYYGNDEIVMESPPYNIPTVTFTKYPFDSYHTHLDNIESFDFESLYHTFESLISYITVIDQNRKARLSHSGVVCLSSYNLYKHAHAPGIDNLGTTDNEKVWNVIMNKMPRHLESGLSLLEIASIYDVNISELLSYAKQWEANSLLELLSI